jgi:MSHA biogenesis protein MshQ
MMNIHQKTAIRWLLGYVIATIFSLAALPAIAATYAYRNDVFSYDTPSVAAKTVVWHTSNAAPACTAYPNGDDDWADINFASTTSPANNFTFTFAGVVQTGVRVYSNGMLVFNNDNSGYWRNYTNATLPSTANATAYTGCNSGTLNNAIIGYWTDIVAGTANNTTGASVQYELLGTAPNRRLVISWVNVKLYGSSTRFNFQIALYESPAGGLNSNFKYQYTTGSSTGSSATVGVQVSPTDSTLYAYNQAFIDPAIGSAILWYPANQLAGKNAEYHFDESTWNGTPSEIKDTSGNGQNASRVGSPTNVANGKVCRAGSFANNTSNTTIDAVATPISPSSTGSIDFWFYSNAKWQSADATLFDATTSTISKPFLLMKTAAGALKFLVTDSSGTILTSTSANQTFAANTWHHVGVSWNLRPGSNQTLLQVFLDGVLTQSTRSTSSGSITALSTIYLGDNRISGSTPTGGSPNSANGIIDEVNMYSTEINANQAMADMNATHACTSLDHFHIIHNGTAVTCDTTPITIEAHDINHALISLTGINLTLSTSTGHGNWSTLTGGSIGPVTNNGNGSGNYIFSNESSVTFGLQNSNIESLVISATSGTVSTTSGAAATCTAADYTFGTSCNTPLSFAAAGFRFVDSNGNPIANLYSGATSPTYYLQAVKQGTSSGVCTSLFPAGTAVNINLATECNNPGNCQSGQALTFIPGTNAGTAGILATNNNGTITATTGNFTSKALTFNATTLIPAVPFTFQFPDAGQIRLWASCTTPNCPTTISGSSQFIVAPTAFKFTGIPAAPIKAGKTFSANITAVNRAGAATPNFGRESVPENITLSFNKCQPTGSAAVNGSLSGTVGTFNNGITTVSNLTWSEVGNIDLTANLTSTSYLGSGLDVAGNSSLSGITCSGTGGAGAVGRFVPDHFETTVTQGCNAGGYTYAAQPFTVQVTAKNAAGLTTQNYDGSTNTTPNFAKIVTLSDANAATAGILSNNSIPLTNFGTTSPVIPGTATTNTPLYTFNTAATAPTTIKLRATDTDGISSSGYIEGTVPLRSGRIKLSNASGAETLNLPVPMVAQYYNGTSFVTNTLDNCTTVPVPTTPNATTGLATTLTTTATLSSPFIAGNGNLQLSKPNAKGYVDITIAAPTWLQYNWKGTGLSKPTARATFGIYKNANEFIYMREMY